MGFQKKDELTGFSKKGRVECPSTEAEAAVSAGWSPGCWGEGGRQTCTWNKTGGNTQRHSLKYTKYSLECNNRELHKEHKNIIIKRNLVELNQSPSQFFTWNRWRPADKYMQTSGELHIRRRRILILGNYSPAQKETNRETGKKGRGQIINTHMRKMCSHQKWGNLRLSSLTAAYQPLCGDCEEGTRSSPASELDPPRLCLDCECERGLDPPRLQPAPGLSGRSSWTQNCILRSWTQNCILRSWTQNCIVRSWTQNRVLRSWIQAFSNLFQATGGSAETLALTDSFEWKVQDFILAPDLQVAEC